jgi:hypothetical protein
MRGRILTILLLATAVAVVAPCAALAVEGTPPPETEPGQREYDLDFTLPTAGKSGCLVCHDDPSLVRIEDGQEISLHVDVLEVQQSAHANVACTGCHLDFAFKTPHENLEDGDAWRRTAKLACANCHKAESDALNVSVHSPTDYPETGPTAASASEEPTGTPLCGDCHGSHSIPSLEDSSSPEAYDFHTSGIQMCGPCHEAETLEYDDYYHGAAYRRGAPDAPACWDCHSAHAVLPAENPKSQVHPTNLQATCNQCHEDTDAAYVSYAEIIHRKGRAYSENPVYSFFEGIGAGISGLFDTVQSWFE